MRTAMNPMPKPRRKVLVLDQEFPRFDRNSGGLRMYELIRVLCAMRTDITFLPYDLEDHPYYGEALRQMKVKTLCRPEIDSIAAHLEARGSRYDLIILCRMPQARLVIDDVKRFAPQARLIFDTVDVHYLRLSRQAETQNSDELRAEARLWKRWELALMRKTDCTIVVSEPEKQLLTAQSPGVPVSVVSNIHRVIALPLWSENRTRLLYLGNFHHLPNVDAVRHLVKDILPLIRRDLPEIQLDIVGEYREQTIEDLEGNGIRLHGHQSNLTPFFAAARVFVAPLRYGAGVKGKLHTSMSYGVPLVTTSIGAEGMHLEHGETAFIADDSAAFAAHVVRLFADRILWERMATAAQKILNAHFSPGVAHRNLLAVLSVFDRRPRAGVIACEINAPGDQHRRLHASPERHVGADSGEHRSGREPSLLRGDCHRKL